MKIFSTLLLTFFAECAFAQNPIFIEPDKEDADSLRLIVQMSSNDTLVMASCRGLALYYLDVNVDSSKYYSGRALSLSRKLKTKLWEVDALDLNAIALNRSSDYSKSLEYLMQAIQLGSDPKSELDIWRISAFTPTYNQTNARKSMLATVYLDLGNLYFATNFHDEAFLAYRKSIALATEIGDYTIPSVVYGGMADSYTALNMLDSAKISIRVGMLYGDSANYYKYRGDDYNRLATVATLLDNMEEAKSYFLEGLKWNIDQKNVIGEGEGYVFLSRLYYSEGALDSSYFYAKKGLNASQNAIYKSQMLQSNNQLYQIHKALNQQDSAFFYLEKSKALSDSINAEEQIKQFQNIGFEEQLRVQELEASEEEYINRLRMNTLLGSTFTLVVVAILLFRNGRSRRKAKQKIEEAYEKLKSTQSQLIQSEKMASLGELTAGIAHEIQNPLNFVNNFAEVSTDLIQEMNDEYESGNADDAKEISGDLRQNLEKITHHGKRASSIVKGMLEHSRSGDGKKELTDINTLADEYLRLAYHGLRAKDKSFNADFKTELDDSLPKVNVVPQDIGRVLLNLINNAFHAVSNKNKGFGPEPVEGSTSTPASSTSTSSAPDALSYKPTVIVSTKKLGDKIQISIKDNGPGIPDNIKDKIFQPFFTTKATGEGTGLGLSLSYDIVTTGHGGTIEVKSKEGVGTEFIIQLSENQNE